MSTVNLENKRFRLLENSDNGAVSESTTFYYSQKVDLVTAIYSGGGVINGQIIATWRGPNQLEMRYQCILEDHTIKAGKADAEVTINDDGLIELHLQWQWMGDNPENGRSVYIEVQ